MVSAEKFVSENLPLYVEARKPVGVPSAILYVFARFSLMALQTVKVLPVPGFPLIRISFFQSTQVVAQLSSW